MTSSFFCLICRFSFWFGGDCFIAERALQIRQGTHAANPLGRYMALKARQSLGLILPVILLYVIRRDVLAGIFQAGISIPLAEPLEIAVAGHVYPDGLPLFIRLAWPTRSLPDGPLRRRLVRISKRVGFRFTDILVWDTGNTMVNACVTGILPRFRYVLADRRPDRGVDAARNRGGLWTRDRPHRPSPSPLLRLFLHGEPGPAHGA